MLKHKHILILFVVLTGVLITLDRSMHIPWYGYAVLLVLFLSIESWGAANIQSGFHLESICKGITDKKEIALTFDDGPAEETKRILDLLKKENLKATFFLIGHHIEGKESIVKRIVDEGHTIGNHSYEHNYWFDLKSKKQFLTDLSRTGALIERITGKKPRFFRPPYGVTTPALARAVGTLGYLSIGWSIRSLDTLKKGTEITTGRIISRLHPGAIVLLHDPINGTELVLEKLINDLRLKGYRVVPLTQLIAKEAYA